MLHPPEGLDLAAALVRICENGELRREMLWLLAMERRDERQARRLELLDAGLRDRLSDVIQSAADLPPEEASKRYGTAYERLLQRA